MEAKILALLGENARMSIAEMAARIGADADQVRAEIADLEKRGVIRGYKAILNEDVLAEEKKVRALIEVKVTPRRDGGFDQAARRIARRGGAV